VSGKIGGLFRSEVEEARRGMPRPRRRTTRSRRAIAEAIARLERSFSARELYEAVRAQGDSVGLTTVYRTLALLLAEGRVREAGQRDGEALYTACAADGHHHHLVCERCGTVEESTVCRCDELERELTREYGFVLSSAPETYYGLCAACVRRDRAMTPSRQGIPRSRIVDGGGRTSARLGRRV
jgi:Fur family ferric uptake transcriptional regulator